MRLKQPRVEIVDATRKDDAALRDVLRRNPMPGNISVAFEREPSFYDALEVEGEENYVVAARCKANGKLVGFGTRSIKQAYLNGKPTAIGYLSSLRLDAKYRNGLAVARGYRRLKAVHIVGNVSHYFTTIIDDNHLAKKLLTSGKAGLPEYIDAGRFFTLALRPSAQQSLTGQAIRQANSSDIESIIELLNREGKKKQLFPVYTAEHLTSQKGLLRGLDLRNILLAFNNNKLIGIMGLWNQSSFRQSIIQQYSSLIHLMRYFYNPISLITDGPTLPIPGKLNYAVIALCCIRDNCIDTFNNLLNQTLYESQNLHSVLLGFHETDPLLAALKKRPHIPYISRLYYVYWENDVSPKPDGRTPYLELGAL